MKKELFARRVKYRRMEMSGGKSDQENNVQEYNVLGELFVTHKWEIDEKGELFVRRLLSLGNQCPGGIYPGSKACRVENSGGKSPGRKKFGGKMGPSRYFLPFYVVKLCS